MYMVDERYFNIQTNKAWKFLFWHKFWIPLGEEGEICVCQLEFHLIKKRKKNINKKIVVHVSTKKKTIVFYFRNLNKILDIGIF